MQRFLQIYGIAAQPVLANAIKFFQLHRREGFSLRQQYGMYQPETPSRMIDDRDGIIHTEFKFIEFLRGQSVRFRAPGGEQRIELGSRWRAVSYPK